MIYVICHTHWDREWFAPSSITNEWLKELFKRLFNLIEKNKEYTYVLDGQTLILEDLLNEAPEVEHKVRSYVKSGNLIIGPFYAQIDFRISPESAIVKNLQIGQQDMNRFGVNTRVSWMVDNFGFISQLPQLLRRYDIEGAFLWRGVSFDKPVTEFFWKSSDGSQIKCVFLIGGYRNFYGIFFTKDLAEKRLQHETTKLKPFSLSGYLLLLDGYDLDVNPEDPTELLGKKVVLSTPEDFLKKVFSKSADFPLLKGDMISGKYACVFPGTLSTRVYLKRQAYIIGKLLRYLEFLSFSNGKGIDDLYRCYLKTLVHDNICGVGIDKIHKRMMREYRNIYIKIKGLFFQEMKEILQRTDLKGGKYIVSFSPFEYNHWHCDSRVCYKLKSNGIGFFEFSEVDKPTMDRSLSFENDYYTAKFCEDGTLKVNEIITGVLKLERELGDSYSTDAEDLDFSVNLLKIYVEKAGHRHKIVRLQRIVKTRGVQIKTEEKIVFDESPLVKWYIKADLRGKNYLLSFVTKTFDSDSKILAKMPFEIVERKRVDRDLFDLDAGYELNSLLLAAREVGSVKKFPFQGFVALSSDKTVALMGKGIYQYEVSEKGEISIDLVRSVEWIAKSKVKGRTGDAGPFIYVPDAKCEGKMSFELAICDLGSPTKSKEFFKWFTLFDDPPMRISLKKEKGRSRSLSLYRSDLPWVCIEDGRLVIYNPYSELTETLEPGQISSFLLNTKLGHRKSNVDLKIFDFPAFPSFISKKTISQKTIDSMGRKIDAIEKQIELLESKLKRFRKNSKKYHVLKHKILSKRRTQLELKVSLSLNKGRIPKGLMRKLNQARSQRRIYDHIIELSEEG